MRVQTQNTHPYQPTFIVAAMIESFEKNPENGKMPTSASDAARNIHFVRGINPPMPRGWGVPHQIWAYVQLGLYPIVGLLFSVLPALEAQTRLMLGMYLEYQVTEKVSEGTA